MKQFIKLFIILLNFSYFSCFPLIASETLNEPIVPIPEPDITNPELIELGRQLFHEPKLSGDGTISCASCHSLTTGGVDQLVVSKGIDNQPGGINAPTVFNSGLNIKQFWDGRAFDLMEQAGGPIQNPIEMGSNWQQVLKVLGNEPAYQKQFAKSFSDGITSNNIKAAIVAFEETLLTPGSRFDQYLLGSKDAISGEELAGYQLFKQYGCTSCHQGMAVGGNLFQKFGIMNDYFADRGNIGEADFGLFNVTKNEADKYVFKVPTLRNIELTQPYLHDGSSSTLDDVVEKMMVYQLGITPVEKDIELIVMFLKTLTGTYQGKPL